MIPSLEPLEARTLPSFTPPVFYSASANVASVAVGDFDGDDGLDLASAAERLFPDWLHVWLGNGNGTLQTPSLTPFRRPNQPALVTADFNGDGRLDLAVTTGTVQMAANEGVHVLLNRGGGSFQVVSMESPDGSPHTLAAGDFDRDGQLDLAVTIGVIRPMVRVFVGQGDGTFRLGPRHEMARFTWGVAAGDFNADGLLDLVVTCPGGIPPARGDVRVLLGNGDGTFRQAVPYAAGRNPVRVTVADFNGDGQEDFAVANSAQDATQVDGSVSVHLGNGDGSFQPAVHYTTGRGTAALAVGDFNRDGIPDLAAAYDRDAAGSLVILFLGRGDGTFQEAGSYLTGLGPTSVAVGDFNGDSHPDLATANRALGNVALLLNDGVWPNRPVVHFYVYPAAGQVTAGVPFDISVLALNALYGLVPGYTGSVGVFTTDPLGTPPFVYQYRPADQGIASFPRGLTLRTPGQQLVYVYDTATFQVYSAAVFDVVGASPGRGGALDAHAVRALFANAAALPPAEPAERLPAAPARLAVTAPRPAVAPVSRDAPAPAAPVRSAWPLPLLDRLFAERYENVLAPPR